MMPVEVVDHPCVQHKMALLRDRNTGHKDFRDLTTEITLFLCYEALKHVDLERVEVETPMAPATCRRIANEILLVPILRAGVGMLDGALELVPTARVGFVGLYRDPDTKRAVEYYRKFPAGIRDPLCLILDPMLATGGSTVAALDMLTEAGLSRVFVVCIITCPEGVATVDSAHRGTTIYTAAVDDHMDEHKYIIPGLGDAGDRLYGTR
jgi:uracil phosphoribosyltransferase